MKNIKITLCLVVAVTLKLTVMSQEKPAENPIIWADVPDVAIVRVGGTFYMSSTTMHMSPGLPIMKSKNLVDWELIGYAYDTLEDTDGLSLRNGKSEYGAGSWASSIRYHDGTFYVSTFAGSTRKTHVYTTRDIENEPWRETTFSPLLHDHSLFFDDDGKVYMIHGAGDIHLTELQTDLSGVKIGGFDQVIIPKVWSVGSERPCLAEGSQLFKHDGKYYLCNIIWPPNDMRTEIIHRADKITGPYEGRVILKDRGIAQGSLIDTLEGKWYAYLFQDCGAVGRVPFLMPVEWKDGWPVLGTDGKVPLTLNIPKKMPGLGNLVASDDFDRSDEMLARLNALPKEENSYLREVFSPAWQWNHNPDNRFWSLTERPGWLRLTTGRIDKTLPDARNSLTQRTFGPQCSATTLLDVGGMKDGDYVGLAAFQKRYGSVGVKMTDGVKSVVMLDTDDKNLPVTKMSVPLETNLIFLKVECDFKERKDEARFYWSLDGKEWKRIGPLLKMTYTLPHFMGYRFALFHFATEQVGGHVDFDFYYVAPVITE